MTAPDNPPQFDLFDAGPKRPRQRVGRKPHLPTPEQRLLANELKARGESWAVIGRALGVSRCTLARHYFPSTVASPPKGRRRHAATPSTRRIVRRAILGGMPVAKVAKLIGISVPTLRLHYGDELKP
jgi:DNA invertase Pin-like site-specific DNA recombinase